MSLDLINDLLAGQDLIFRLVLIVLISLYGLFALIVAIQISNLNKSLNQIGFSPIFNALTIIHFFAALALLVYAVISL